MRLIETDGVGALSFIHVRKVAREQRADVHPVFAVHENAVALVLQVTMYLKQKNKFLSFDYFNPKIKEVPCALN